MNIIKLGRHRIICGDARKDIPELLGNTQVDLLLTDPPYGISAVKKDGSIGGGDCPRTFNGNVIQPRLYKPIYGDDKPFNPQHLLEHGTIQILFGANNFCHALPERQTWLAWDKGTSKGMDLSGVEFAWVNKRGAKKCPLYKHVWAGATREGDQRTELTTRIHPTQKPVGLMADIIKDYSKDRDIVLDPYLGSGSTLIACERTGRTCYGMEIQQEYVDEIVKRFWAFAKYDDKQITLGTLT